MRNYIEYELLVTINNAINTLNELDTSKYKEDLAFLADRIYIDATNVVVRVLDDIIARKADFENPIVQPRVKMAKNLWKMQLKTKEFETVVYI